MWKWGVLVYGQALTLSTVAIIIYFAPFRKLFTDKYKEDAIPKSDYRTVRQDMQLQLEVFYDKS